MNQKNERFISKLPITILSVQNAILVITSSRFLLLIDLSTNIENLVRKKGKKKDSISMGEAVLEISLSVVD